MPSEKVSDMTLYILTAKEVLWMSWQWLIVGAVLGFAVTLAAVGVVAMVVSHG